MIIKKYPGSGDRDVFIQQVVVVSFHDGELSDECDALCGKPNNCVFFLDEGLPREADEQIEAHGLDKLLAYEKANEPSPVVVG
jgi:hypothetical protein